MTAACALYKQHRNLFKDVNKERLKDLYSAPAGWSEVGTHGGAGSRRLISDQAMHNNTASKYSIRKETTIAVVNICNCVFTAYLWLFFAAISGE